MVVHYCIFENTVHIIARFAEWNFFDPFHDPDAARARVAISAKPFVNIPGTAIISRDGERIAAAIIIEHPFDIGRTQRDVIIRIDRQRLGAVGHGDLARCLPRCARHKLHQAARAGVANSSFVELTFLTHNRMSQRPGAAMVGWHIHGWIAVA